MADKPVKEFLITLGVDASAAEKALKKADEGSTQTAGNISKTFKDMGKNVAGSLAVIGAAATAAFAGLFKLAEGVAIAGDEVAKKSKKIGAGIVELQRLRFAADRSGAASQLLDRGIRNVSRNIENTLSTGTGQFAEALERLGIELEDLDTLSAEKRLGLIGDRLKTVENSGERTALAMRLVGEEAGPQLVPLLLEGSKGIKALGDEAERLGGVIGEDAARDAEAFIDAQTDMKLVLTGLKATIGSEIIPIFTDMLNGVRDNVLANREMIATKVGDFFRDLVPKLKPVLDLFIQLVELSVDLVGMLADVSKALGGVDKAAGIAAAGFVGLRLATTAALGPFGLIAGAFIALLPVAMKLGDAIGDIAFNLSAAGEEAKRLDALNNKIVRKREKAGFLGPQTTAQKRARAQIEKDQTLLKKLEKEDSFFNDTTHRQREARSRIAANLAELDRTGGRAVTTPEPSPPPAPAEEKPEKDGKGRGRKGKGKGPQSLSRLRGGALAQAGGFARLETVAEQLGASELALRKAATDAQKALTGGASIKVATAKGVSSLESATGLKAGPDVDAFRRNQRMLFESIQTLGTRFDASSKAIEGAILAAQGELDKGASAGVARAAATSALERLTGRKAQEVDPGLQRLIGSAAGTSLGSPLPELSAAPTTVITVNNFRLEQKITETRDAADTASKAVAGVKDFLFGELGRTASNLESAKAR